jgi:hypothetical protein
LNDKELHTLDSLVSRRITVFGPPDMGPSWEGWSVIILIIIDIDCAHPHHYHQEKFDKELRTAAHVSISYLDDDDV